MEDLLPLLAIGAYWLVRAMRSTKRKQAGPRPAPTGAAKAPSPFEQLMLQLEEALDAPRDAAPADADAAAAPERSEEPPRPVERQAERPPAPRAAPRPPRAVPTHFDDAGIGDYHGFDHDRHGFGQDNPLSEEAFERRPRFAPRPKTPPRRYDPHGLAPTPKPPPRRAVSWATRLRDPAAAREALVLKTIFEGPWRPRSGRNEP